MRSRWPARLAAPLLGMIALATPVALSPAEIDAQPAVGRSDCPALLPEGAALRGAGPFPVEPVLTTRGELAGRQVRVEPRHGPQVSLTLAAESFVAGQFGDRLLYGEHRPAIGSEIRALSLESGCSVRLASPPGVVRGALPDAAGTALYVHTVTEEERRDGGVTRIDLASGETEATLAPFEPDPSFGPVFATALHWTGDGKALAVQSCGLEACVTRVVALADGSVTTYDAHHGPLVAATASDLIAFAAEHSRPAELLAVDLATGDARILVEDAFDARVTGDGATLLVETPAGWQEVRP